ncbi:MAG: hypothetical protein GXO34_01490 [Deltaproteobacteria bacterium]|nr:hypothetical protein [Deltaproteobacteria bacterium]
MHRMRLKQVLGGGSRLLALLLLPGLLLCTPVLHAAVHGGGHGEAAVDKPSLAADGLLPIPPEKIKPRTNEECIKCHKEKHLAAGRLDGSAARLYVDYELFKQTKHGKKLECIDCHEDAAASRHCRSGFKKVNCLACHSKIEGLYPYGARERLKKKGVRMPKRKLVGDSYYKKSKHGKAFLAGKKDAPNCYNCHTRHYIFGKRDLRSSVNRKNLVETCSACHKERKLDTLLEKMAAFRLEAHRKGDMSYDYDRGNCIDCHQGTAVHGLKINDAPCSRCHDSSKKVKGVSLAGLGPFHLYPDYENQYPVWCMRNFYGLMLLLLVAGAGLWLFYYVLKSAAAYYRKEGGEE